MYDPGKQIPLILSYQYYIMEKKKAVLNWSSGKDAALAYWLLLGHPEYEVECLLTTVNETNSRVVMHGIREELLDLQAVKMKMPLHKVKYQPSTDHIIFESAVSAAYAELKEAGFSAAAFGDIYLEDLRQYREKQLAQVGLAPLFPLWKQDTQQIITLLEEKGIEAIIICVNEQYLGKEFLGQKISKSLIRQFPTHIDPCGENGEFHTLVVDAPFFESRIPYVPGEIVYHNYASADEESKRNGAYFLDIHL